MTAPATPLRVLRFEVDSPTATTILRERNAHSKAAQASQKLTADVSGWLTSYVSDWLQKHAGPAVAEWLEDRTSRPILVGLSRAAKLLDLSESTIERMIADGHLPTVRVGSRVLIRRADLEAWAEGLPTREVVR
jgi:excisionase family DNA binding protein